MEKYALFRLYFVILQSSYTTKQKHDDKSYALPRTGKDIIVTTWHEDGKKTQKTLKWTGSGFSY